MEQSQIAIAANGRTPYELAHMNIPSIILSHHERELGHSFATRERGFIPLGLYKGAEKDEKILKALKKMVENHDFRREYFDRMRPFRFQKNKKKVLKFIYKLLEN
jgi:spore coat polysaccharide biosynthesis predicted glycosyltransferase SpsG